MTYNPQQYETVYGFSILDELHNFMPEALYDEAMFPDETLAYFRHRMSRLFQSTFVRQKHTYNIYMAQARRAEFAEWRRSRAPPVVPSAAPSVVPSVVPSTTPDLLTAINEALNSAISNVRFEIPITGTVPETPPAQIRRRNTAVPSAVARANIGAGNLIGVNTVGQSLRAAISASAPGSAPGGDSATPPRRHRNPANSFITANQFFNLTTPISENSLLTTPIEDGSAFLNFITGTMLREFDVPITGTGAGARRFWEEVDVIATPEQIEAGSTILEQSAIPVDANCAICQEHTYAEGDSSHQWRQLRCSHQFHIECVDSWLEQSVHCPVCRADIRGESAESSDDASYAAAARRGARND